MGEILELVGDRTEEEMRALAEDYRQSIYRIAETIHAELNAYLHRHWPDHWALDSDESPKGDYPDMLEALHDAIRHLSTMNFYPPNYQDTRGWRAAGYCRQALEYIYRARASLEAAANKEAP